MTVISSRPVRAEQTDQSARFTTPENQNHSADPCRYDCANNP
jgi:hypothetical protein